MSIDRATQKPSDQAKLLKLEQTFDDIQTRIDKGGEVQTDLAEQLLISSSPLTSQLTAAQVFPGGPISTETLHSDIQTSLQRISLLLDDSGNIENILKLAKFVSACAISIASAYVELVTAEAGRDDLSVKSREVILIMRIEEELLKSIEGYLQSQQGREPLTIRDLIDKIRLENMQLDKNAILTLITLYQEVLFGRYFWMPAEILHGLEKPDNILIPPVPDSIRVDFDNLNTSVTARENDIADIEESTRKIHSIYTGLHETSQPIHTNKRDDSNLPSAPTIIKGLEAIADLPNLPQNLKNGLTKLLAKVNNPSDIGQALYIDKFFGLYKQELTDVVNSILLPQETLNRYILIALSILTSNYDNWRSFDGKWSSRSFLPILSPLLRFAKDHKLGQYPMQSTHNNTVEESFYLRQIRALRESIRALGNEVCKIDSSIASAILTALSETESQKTISPNALIQALVDAIRDNLIPPTQPTPNHTD
ncbi:MAG: hypothetical protein H7230_01340 [Candidatus Parcubacteria bacterium]|nr:hypothetical protein [Candidatus Paceibacterota bacterium]